MVIYHEVSSPISEHFLITFECLNPSHLAFSAVYMLFSTGVLLLGGVCVCEDKHRFANSVLS